MVHKHKWGFNSEIWKNGIMIHPGGPGQRCLKCGATKTEMSPKDFYNEKYGKTNIHSKGIKMPKVNL